MADVPSVKTKLTAKEYLATYPITSQPMELINGEVITMPAPFDRHSDIVANVMWVLMAIVKPHQLGKVKDSPTDVHFDEYNIVQPDVLFIHKDNAHCQVREDGYLHGAPDLCVEILSESTAKRDRTVKFDLYERFGVREYWMVDPALKLVEVYQREGEYLRRAGAYDETQQFACGVLPEMMVKVGEIFEGV